MKSYKEFRDILGLKGIEVEKITGYTRQGLTFSFKQERPAHKLQIAMRTVVDKQSFEEQQRYESRMLELQQLRKNFE